MARQRRAAAPRRRPCPFGHRTAASLPSLLALVVLTSAIVARAIVARAVVAGAVVVGAVPWPAGPAAAQPTFSPARAPARCRPALPGDLSTTEAAAQLVTVESAGWSSTTARVSLWDRQEGCWEQRGGPWPALIGRNGFSDHHREGDGTTPAGIYAIGRTVYGNAPNPGVHTAYHRLVCGDWWDEDPRSPSYNTFQHFPCGQRPPFAVGSEALWTETEAYASFAVVEYNMHPVVPYAGSAIFVHASTGQPTEGCVSLSLSDLDYLLRALDWHKAPMIVMGPAPEIRQF